MFIFLIMNIDHINNEKINGFRKNLLNWYLKKDRRSFLWRNKSATNYQLIISEVFLQRTKAETVAKYLPIFFKQYPSWKKLGEATERDLIEILKPIGLYNQRGKRLYRLAQELKKRNGRFPKDSEQVQEMSMMGQYITNAFELYILNKNSPLLDVNMARVLERYFGERKLADIRYDPYLQELSNKVVNIDNSKELNWAILDFAALVCKKRSPFCEPCFLKTTCNYYSNKL